MKQGTNYDRPLSQREHAVKDLANRYAMAVAAADLGVPNGHLYAMVATRLGRSLDEHNAAIAVLKSGGLVEEEANYLTWAGDPKLARQIRAALAASEEEGAS